MIQYRPFRNDDPPAIAELWCNHPPTRGLVQPMSPSVLERTVFSKPYFDRHGLIIAENDQHMVGFVHAGFGAKDDGSELSTEVGATCMLMVAPCEQREQIATELLKRSEQYLIEHGARKLLGGCVYPVNPFYLGLYGGSQSPGVLESDAEMVDLCRRAGYEQTDCRVVFQLKLAGYRPPIDRRRRILTRTYRIVRNVDPPSQSWWEACTLGQMERTRFEVCAIRGKTCCGTVTFWNMEPLSTRWGVHATGIMDLDIDKEVRRQGVGIYLVGEGLRQMHENGMSLAEIHILEDNGPAIELFKKLGFQQVDRGLVMRKQVPMA